MCDFKVLVFSGCKGSSMVDTQGWVNDPTLVRRAAGLVQGSSISGALCVPVIQSSRTQAPNVFF